LKVHQAKTAPDEDESNVWLRVELSVDEYKKIIYKSGFVLLSRIPFPLPKESKEVKEENFLNLILNREKICLNVVYGLGVSDLGLRLLEKEMGRISTDVNSNPDGFPWLTGRSIICRMNDEWNLEIVDTRNTGSQPTLQLYDLLVSEFRSRLYFFKAQRPIPSRCPDGGLQTLLPDATNLAEVLSNLSADRSTQRKFDDLVRLVLPQIYEVTTHKVKNNLGLQEIIVYETESSAPIQLEHCGSGVAQVLAMLYVLATAKGTESMIIIIDEPQSFLHPGAVRRLMAVFREHDQHQYIISTHDPNVIAAAQPSTISLVTKERGKPSVITPIDVRQTQELRYCLNQVGASLSDVFGADFVLWVEGPTESECYPLIIDKLTDLGPGVVVVPVTHTDELSGRDTERLIKMYERLSSGVGVRPEATGFLLDRECRSGAVMKDLISRTQRRLGFLEYRMYENYLVDADAITAALKEFDADSQSNLTAEEINDYLKTLIQDESLYCAEHRSLADHKSNWKQYIHGAQVLHRLFAKFADTRLDYDSRKREYGLYLTRWILQNKQELLEGVARQLKQLVASS
jgi:hypothetical protein